MTFHPYYVNSVKKRRPYLEDAWCARVLADPVRVVVQEDGRIQHWGYIEELGKYLRVVTLPDGDTVFNAFPDRGFTP